MEKICEKKIEKNYEKNLLMLLAFSVMVVVQWLRQAGTSFSRRENEMSNMEAIIEAVRDAIGAGEHSRAALVANGNLGTPAEVEEALMRLYLRGVTKVWDDAKMVDLV